MDEAILNATENLKLANLSEKQEKELRKFEKKFNDEFDSSLYFMVFDRSNHPSIT